MRDVRTELPYGRKMSVPIAQLSTLGTGVASLLPMFRTVSQSAEINTANLYRWVNEGAGNALKVVSFSDGSWMGEIKNPQPCHRAVENFLSLFVRRRARTSFRASGIRYGRTVCASTAASAPPEGT